MRSLRLPSVSAGLSAPNCKLPDSSYLLRRKLGGADSQQQAPDKGAAAPLLPDTKAPQQGGCELRAHTPCQFRHTRKITPRTQPRRSPGPSPCDRCTTEIEAEGVPRRDWDGLAHHGHT
eukprot:1212623-Prymnesium_polylepis.2